MLKPDRFKILVDSRGHAAGDEAMVKIAMILKNITRRIGRGWPLRFKSNETGILINKCSVSLAETVVKELSRAIVSLAAVPKQGDIPAFSFSGTIAYALWPEDGHSWEKLFEGCYSLLLDTWKQGGGKITRYRIPADEKEAP
jgi:GGDEF domain-containing protein